MNKYEKDMATDEWKRICRNESKLIEEKIPFFRFAFL